MILLHELDVETTARGPGYPALCVEIATGVPGSVACRVKHSSKGRRHRALDDPYPSLSLRVDPALPAEAFESKSQEVGPLRTSLGDAQRSVQPAIGPVVGRAK